MKVVLGPRNFVQRTRKAEAARHTVGEVIEQISYRKEYTVHEP
jgi:hypothetical protein